MARIGTGNYVTQYSRPTQHVVTDQYAKDKIDKGYYKEIAPGMYAHTFKIGRHAATYLFMQREGKWRHIIIPTLPNGQIRDTVMAERILDVEDGDRQNHMRNVFIDIGIDAESRCKPEDLAESYRWYIYPNESDVKSIDDSKTKIVTILGADKAKGKPPTRLIITGGTEIQRQQIADGIRLNFTGRERDILKHCLVQIVPSARGFAGCFQGHADMAGKPLGVPKIIIVAEHAKDSDVIIHEAIHALREFDPKRDYRFRAVKQYMGRDADLEESLTEAETVTRQNPFTKHESSAGYYHFIKIPEFGDTGWETVPVTRGMTHEEAEKAASKLRSYLGQKIRLQDKDKVTRPVFGPLHSVAVSPNTDGSWQLDLTLGLEHEVFGRKDWHAGLGGASNWIASVGGEVKPPKTTKDLIVEDRVTVTGQEKFLTGGQRGKRAIKALTLKYPSMFISKLKIKGGAEAIDTYWQTNNRRGDPTPPPGAKTTLHFYDPKGTNEPVIASELKEEGKVTQFEDGKAISRGGDSSVTIRTVPDKERTPKEKPRFSVHRRAAGASRGRDLGADIVKDRRGRHLRL